MKHLDFFKRFKNKKEEDSLDKKILSIIDSEITKSRELGLFILPEDQIKEKKVILESFKKRNFKKTSEYTNSEYSITLRELKEEIFN